MMMIDAGSIPVGMFISFSAQPLSVPWLRENPMVPGMSPCNGPVAKYSVQSTPCRAVPRSTDSASPVFISFPSMSADESGVVALPEPHPHLQPTKVESMMDVDCVCHSRAP